MTVPLELDRGLHRIDLQFQAQPGVIAAYLFEDAGERALIETGPTSTLDALLHGLALLDVDPTSISKILVTHIHLDHAGAAGTLIRRFPQAHLYVHEIGAPHMIDPERLLVSARRIYGEQMDSLWGAFEPVPDARVHPLTDGDTVVVGDNALDAIYTPGHASHHIAYHDARRHAIFTGDVAGVRLQGLDYVRPPTPPPDLDLDLWSDSVERIRALQPETLHLTHFGTFTDIETHFSQLLVRLKAWGYVLKANIEDGHDRDQLIEDLAAFGSEEIRESGADNSAAERLELATPYFMSVDGYLRYFRRRSH
ncbi:MAG: MBL fold metallo-hydrolase [Chloroflexota bacterium]|nr:MAG: MBL fold metallo-hydrolase [Chloroflexota bacterium]